MDPSLVPHQVVAQAQGLGSGVAEQLLSQGLSGIVILVLGLTVYKLYTRKEELQTKREAEIERVLGILMKYTNTFEGMTEVMEAQSKLREAQNTTLAECVRLLKAISRKLKTS